MKRRFIVSLTVAVLYLPSYSIAADCTLTGNSSQDETIVYGKVHFKQYYWYLDLYGRIICTGSIEEETFKYGICIFERSITSPYRGDPIGYQTCEDEAFDPTVDDWIIYGDDGEADADYNDIIYPADEFGSVAITCLYSSLLCQYRDISVSELYYFDPDTPVEIYGDVDGEDYAGDDWIWGWNNSDTIEGGWGFDYIYGGSGNDTLIGGSDGDIIYGEDGTDNIFGEAGNDYLYQNGCVTGTTVISGGTGGDYLYGSSCVDYIMSNNLWGTNDNAPDMLYGYAGADYLIGDAGTYPYTDRCDGGADTDTCYAAPSCDTFFNCP